MKWLWIILEFFKAGLFSVGGGLATLPFLNQMTQRYDWFTVQELTDMIAISEMTPGAIGINMSTYAGFQAQGIVGAICATAALILPSILIILMIANFMEKFSDSKWIQNGMVGIKAAAGALILGALMSVFQWTFLNREAFFATGQIKDLIRGVPLFLFGICFLLIKKFPSVHPIAFLGIGALIGILLQL